MAELRKVASGLKFPEGPIAHARRQRRARRDRSAARSAASSPDGTVTGDRRHRRRPERRGRRPRRPRLRVQQRRLRLGRLRRAARPIGAQPADYEGGSIQRVDLDSGEVETLYTACGGLASRSERHRLRHPGRLLLHRPRQVARPRPRQGGVYYAKADGSAIVSVVFRPDHPNGIGLSPDGRRLYVAESMTGRVWSWNLEGPGKVGAAGHVLPSAPGTLLIRLPGLAAARLAGRRRRRQRLRGHALVGAVSVISPKGELIDQIKVPSTTCSSPTSASAARASGRPTSRPRAVATCTPPSGRTPASGSPTRAEPPGRPLRRPPRERSGH